MKEKTKKIKSHINIYADYKHRMNILKNKYADEVCYILSCGPSLNDLDHGFVHEKLKDELVFERLVHDDNIAKISVIGTAMRTQSGIAKMMFEVLSEKQINMQVISTSEIKISVLIQADYTELAVRSLHDAFELDKIG